MRIRTIKPEFWSCEDLAGVSTTARLLAIGLLNYADDEGYFNANPKLIKSALFPLDESVNIPAMLIELSKIDYIRVAIGEDGKNYGQVTKFLEHQRISHPKDSKIKDLCTFHASSAHVPHTFHASSTPEGKGREQGTGKGKEQGKGKAAACGKTSKVEDLQIPPELDTLPFCKVWDSWINYRKEIGHKLTPTGAERQLAMLAKAGEKKAVEALNYTMVKGWQGLRFPDENTGGSHGSSKRKTKVEREREAGEYTQPFTAREL